MKKLSYFLILILIFLVIFSIQINAANEFEFDLNYTGTIVLNETKEALVMLKGTNATTYTNVRVKIEISGPGTPKITAIDSLNQEIDLVKEKYWGPPEGFPVAGTFENETPIKATFNVAGTYTVKLSLVNMQNSEEEITSKTFTIEVLEDLSGTNEVLDPENTVENPQENIQDNTIDKLPQTGTSIIEYVIYLSIIAGVILFIYRKTRISKI